MPKLPITIATAAALCALPFLSAAQTSSGAASPSPASAIPGPGNPESPPPAGAASSARTGAAPGATTGTATGATAGASTGTAANTSATGQALAAGMTVKDNTGASIGQIVKLGAGPDGASMATIKMGTDSFQVPAANLAAQDGSATINLTQAQIAAQLHPK